MISVAAARDALLSLVQPTGVETVRLRDAAGRVLARDVAATGPQPPFPASAMDGYAVLVDAPPKGTSFRVVGTSAAGHPFARPLGDGEAVRIFTGAVVPPGARHVVIQEDVERSGDGIIVAADPGRSANIRPAGGDFDAGHVVSGGRAIRPQEVALLGAMGHGDLPVRRRPAVAIMSTGDELRAPGEALDPGAIHASNGEAIAALLSGWGAEVRRLPLVRDTAESLALAFDLARGADLVVTIGGASVGDHDLVAPAAQAAGFDLRFQKVAIRPGKPLMAGSGPDGAMVGLPGNPVSAFVCALVFLRPMIDRLLGRADRDASEARVLAAPLAENGPRAHYMRAATTEDGRSKVAERQDSSLLSVLAESDHLVIRPPHDPARTAGDTVEVLPLPA